MQMMEISLFTVLGAGFWGGGLMALFGGYRYWVEARALNEATRADALAIGQALDLYAAGDIAAAARIVMHRTIDAGSDQAPDQAPDQAGTEG